MDFSRGNLPIPCHLLHHEPAALTDLHLAGKISKRFWIIQVHSWDSDTETIRVSQGKPCGVRSVHTFVLKGLKGPCHALAMSWIPTKVTEVPGIWDPQILPCTGGIRHVGLADAPSFNHSLILTSHGSEKKCLPGQLTSWVHIIHIIPTGNTLADWQDSVDH